MITTCIFDAYGTLFDVASAARAVANEKGQSEFAEHWEKIANTWRLKQLQYTWLRTIMGQHQDFWQVTKDGLDFALEESSMTDDTLRERLLALYWELAAYPEVPELLSSLKSRGLNTGILSNGSPEMLNGAVQSAHLTKLLDTVISVESIGVYKPDMRVYQMVLDHFKCATDQVLFVSSNGWDIAGSCSFGFNTLWVNRTGDPVDRLDAGPKWIANDLTGIPALLKGLT
jgi:2-haloacid dehalogenase